MIAVTKGVNPLERCSQVDFQEMLDFPPAPKLDIFGKLDSAEATPAEMRGQGIFFGKAQCASCHQPPFYTDNLRHDLHTERFALRGVKHNPPYMHDERLLTLDDAVEFLDLVLGDKLTAKEKRDLMAFMRAL